MDKIVNTLPEKEIAIHSNDEVIIIDSQNLGKTKRIKASKFKGEPGDPGANGNPGNPGANGKSAYELWLEAGNTGNMTQFLESLKGQDGSDGFDGEDGENGISAYQVWLNLGNTGTQQDFINSLVGLDGVDGVDGDTFDAKGDYMVGASYDRGDVVLFLGEGYVSTINANTTTPLNVGNWQKIAEKGADGEGGDMFKARNLSGLQDYAIARANLSVYSVAEITSLLAGYSVVSHNHNGVYEPVFSKNTAFNKNFGTSSGTVLEGNNDALYEKIANKGQANGYVPLNAEGLIESGYLPSFVDDVLEYTNLASFPATGTSGKMYVALDTEKVYRWSGTIYSEVSSNNMSDANATTLTNGSNADSLHSHSWGNITGKPSTFTPSAHTHVFADLPSISQNHFLGRSSSGNGTIEVLSATQTRSALSVYSQSEIDGFTVKLTGNQTIAGVKTFSSAPIVPDSSFAIAKISGLQTALDETVKTTGDQTINGQKIFEGQVYIRGGLFAQGNATGQTTGSDIASFKMHNSFNGAIWGIRNKADTNLGFEYYNGASWSEAMTLSSGGNLGVGTTSALGEKINVYHTSWPYIKFLNQFSSNGFRVGNEENIGGYIDMLDNKPIIVRTNSIQRFSISETGLTEVRGILKVTGDGGGWSTQRLLFGGDGSGWQLKIGSINNVGTINATAITIWDNGSLQASAILKSASYYMSVGGQDRFSINEFDSGSGSRRAYFSCYDQNGSWVGNPIEFDNFANGEGTREMRFDANGWRMRFMNLPTSSAGLPSGALWRNGTVVNIVA